MNRIVAAVRTFLRREPAVALGSIAVAASEAQTVLVDNKVADWKTAGVVVLVYVVRRLVTPVADPRLS